MTNRVMTTCPRGHDHRCGDLGCLHGPTAASGRSHPAAVDLDTPFELLGLDSLATIELAAALEDELGCELPADVLVGCTDARSLAARLARLGVGDARRADDPFDQMVADAVLPDDIRPAGRERAPRHGIAKRTHDPPDRRHRIPRLGATRGTARHVERDDRLLWCVRRQRRSACPRRAASAPSPATCRILVSA